MSSRSPGSRIGPYTLRERLAVGGLSEVFLATNAEKRTVVVKLLGVRHARDPLYQDLLRTEARLGRSLSHANVVGVLDFGDADNEPYLVLEHIDGVDLFRLQRALQQTQRRMEAPLACYVVREMLSGIAHLHNATFPQAGGPGVIHRDVSPSNVMLSVVGDVKLGDLGIALPDRNSLPPPSDTRAPAALKVNRGKVNYMAPEQLLGLSVDHRVDLYAAGVVLAEVLTGRGLFAQGNDVGAILAAREARIGSLIESLADHPPSLVSVVLRALARSPSERFQSAEEFRAALQPHIGDPAEERPLLSALVGWAQQSGVPTAPEGDPSKSRASGVNANVVYVEAPDVERTREVPLAFWEVVTATGDSRGRYTFARLLELAFQGSLGRDDRVLSPDGQNRPAWEVPEIAPHLPPASATTPEVATAQADWADALPGCTFLHALSRLVFAEESGLLVAEAPPTRKEVYLFRGRPTHFASNVASEMLGPHLVQSGLLDAGELDMALAMLPRFGGHLGRALVHLQLIDENTLTQHVDRLSREKFLEVFRWRRGTLRFFRSVTPPASSMPLTLDPFEALRTSVQLLEDPAEPFTSVLDRRVVNPRTLKGLQRLGIGPVGNELLLGAHSGMVAVRQLVQRVAAERKVAPQEVFRELHLLVETGALELRGA